MIFVEHENKEDLEKKVDDMFSEMTSMVDNRYCFIEAEAHCEELDLWW